MLTNISFLLSKIGLNTTEHGDNWVASSPMRSAYHQICSVIKKKKIVYHTHSLIYCYI